ncbi:MAG: AraC family transcriptional regulator, partial [Pirellulales bacterium]|nr:AraC family transcriptional regulator [Pirellulales bacterium]
MAINIEKIGLAEGEFFRVLRWSRDVDEVEILGARKRFTPLRGTGSVWHLHDEVELTLVTAGQGTRLVGDQISRFAAPSLVLLGPNLPHCWQFDGASAGMCIQLSVPRLSAALPPSERRELGRVADRAAKGLVIVGSPRRKLDERFAHIVGCDGVARIGCVLQLIGDVAAARGSAIRELSTKRFDVSRLAPGYEAIQRAILLILADFREHLSLDDILAEAHMSKANFSRRFTAYTGKTFTEFLNEVRIDYA